MRLSVRKGDPGYRSDWLDLKASVTLDGVAITNCFTADEELGEAHCYREPLEIDHATGECMEEIRRGVVKIVIPGAI